MSREFEVTDQASRALADNFVVNSLPYQTVISGGKIYRIRPRTPEERETWIKSIRGVDITRIQPDEIEAYHLTEDDLNE